MEISYFLFTDSFLQLKHTQDLMLRIYSVLLFIITLSNGGWREGREGKVEENAEKDNENI